MGRWVGRSVVITIAAVLAAAVVVVVAAIVGDNIYCALRARNRKMLRRLSRPLAFAYRALALALAFAATFRRSFAATFRKRATLRRSTSF